MGNGVKTELPPFNIPKTMKSSKRPITNTRESRIPMINPESARTAREGKGALGS